ncbi:helix-turn-helix transcriptional regulator [Actinoplanes friuliensis]|uniref:MmyB family DNA-binding protein n=1 Tax=Actinoplanes friuliensis DSM 7358 TaxID=1246995 RepID=U5W449_9ACTN|nr:helix-turn-helix transcriptional regulator [Actinoplanes friuliensis]AGZ42686.1 MmyB family DNA-binding protein [Actinoplanes friuliensis DSM 7358]
MDHRRQIQDFLSSRRARISPESVGLPVAGRKRRVPGLRREEVASLAGVSVDYYVRLERGALIAASDTVIEAIARALHLDAVERAHLFDLARAGRRPSSARPRRATPATVAAPVQAVLDALVGAPALVRNPILDVITMNDLGRALYSELHSDPDRPANLARFTFLDPRARNFWVDWDQVADDFVGHLQAAAGTDPDDPALTQLIGELSTRSEQFRRMWARHDVRAHPRGVKRVRHPAVGVLDLRYEVMQLSAEPGLTFVAYTTEPGTPSHDNLSLLAAWTATQQRDAELSDTVKTHPHRRERRTGMRE